MAGQMKCSFLSFSAVLALAVFVNNSAYGAVVVTESFNDDPSARGWSGVNNNLPAVPGGSANIYGFSNTDNTGSVVNPPGGTATGAGEIGGLVNRGPNSFYGVDLGGAVDFNATDMNVKGVINNFSSGSSTTLNLGWGLGIASADGSGGEPGAIMGISWDDGVIGAMMARGNGFGIGSAPGPNRPIDSTTIPFEMNWDSTANTLTMNLNGNIGTLVLSEGDLNDVPDLTHWGMWGRTNASQDNANGLWIDDVTFTAVSVVPEPASLGLLSLLATAAFCRRRRS